MAAERDQNWQLEINKDSIQVYSRDMVGSEVRAMRAETHIQASLTETLKLLLNVARRPDWDAMCVEAYVYQQVSDTEDIIYVRSDLPFPLADRDQVLRRNWSISRDGSVAKIHAVSEAAMLPEVDGVIRLIKVGGTWTIHRLTESSVHIITELHAEPGGPVPDWIVNAQAVQGPFKALHSLRARLELNTE